MMITSSSMSGEEKDSLIWNFNRYLDHIDNCEAADFVEQAIYVAAAKAIREFRNSEEYCWDHSMPAEVIAIYLSISSLGDCLDSRDFKYIMGLDYIEVEDLDKIISEISVPEWSTIKEQKELRS